MIESLINVLSQKIRLDIYKKIFMMYNYMKGVANYVSGQNVDDWELDGIREQ